MDTHDLPRALTAAERAVLDVMLSVDVDGVDTLRRSAERAVVTGGCDCGCPTIYFRPVDAATSMVLVAQGVAGEDPKQIVLLFGNGAGEIESLELEWYAETPPSVFPAPADLHVSPMPIEPLADRDTTAPAVADGLGAASSSVDDHDR